MAVVPSARDGHVGVYAEGNLWIHGGRNGSVVSVLSVLDDLWRFNFQEWIPVYPEGPTPAARHQHVAVHAEGALWLHGGSDWFGSFFGDLWRYEFHRSWSLAHSKWGGVPEPRADHAAAYAAGHIWMHGGRSESTYLDDLWKYDIQAGQWSEVQQSLGPEARHDHVVVHAWGSLWMHGGYNAGGRLPDLWRFDMPNNTWSWVTGTWSQEGHAAAFDGSAIWLLGGRAAPDVDYLMHFNGSGSWRPLQNADRHRPVARSGHVAAFANGSIWLHGGFDGVTDTYLADLWSFDVEARRWSLAIRESSTTTQAQAELGEGLGEGYFWLIGCACGICISVLAYCVIAYSFEFDRARLKRLGCKFIWRRDPDRFVLLLFGFSIFSLLCGVVGLLIVDGFTTESASPAVIACVLSWVLLFLIQFCWVNTRKSFESRTLSDPLMLVAFLVDADIRLVRFDFLEELERSGQPWPRRQEAEAMKMQDGRSALLSHAEMYDWAKSMLSRPKRQRVISVSHCWETMQHADPYGFQQSELVKALRKVLEVDKHCMAGIFIDYISLYQHPRTKEQNIAFQRAMKSMHTMYSHEWTFTFCIPNLTPPDLKDATQDEEVQVFWQPDPQVEGTMTRVPVRDLKPNETPYDKRGWCIAELHWSSLRSSNGFWDEVLEENEVGVSVQELLPDQGILDRAPMMPAAFRNELSKSDVRFTHRTDFVPLINAQMEAFTIKQRECTELSLHRLLATEVDILADSVQSCNHLRRIRLTRCDASVSGLALRLSWVQSLVSVALHDCELGDTDAEQFADALSSARWKTLDFRKNRIGDAGAKKFAEALKDNLTLKYLWLPKNEIGDAGASALVDAWRGSPTHLNLKDQRLGRPPNDLNLKDQRLTELQDTPSAETVPLPGEMPRGVVPGP